MLVLMLMPILPKYGNLFLSPSSSNFAYRHFPPTLGFPRTSQVCILHYHHPLVIGILCNPDRIVHHLHSASIRSCITLSIQLTSDPLGGRGERTASAMETQLTALERKLDDLLATVASADAGGSKRDEAAPETASHVTRTHQNQPDEK